MPAEAMTVALCCGEVASCALFISGQHKVPALPGKVAVTSLCEAPKRIGGRGKSKVRPEFFNSFGGMADKGHKDTGATEAACKKYHSAWRGTG